MSKTKHILAFALAASALPAARADVVYQNNLGPFGVLNPGTVQVGDELVLAGSSRVLTSFSLQYFSSVTLSGNEQARVWLLANNGPALPGNPTALTPSGILYDSSPFAIGAASGGLTLNFDTSNGTLDPGIVLPNHVTLAVQFSGLEAGEMLGVSLSQVPTVGTSEADYWYNDPVNGWQLRVADTNVVGAVAINFSSGVQAVPEPSTWAMGITGGLLGLAFLRRRTSRK